MTSFADTRPGIAPALSSMRSNRSLLAATFVCFVFGICLVLNTETSSDGGWYLYDRAILNGNHIYRDLHSNMQPLYFLETSFWLHLLGPKWVFNIFLPIFHLILFISSLALIIFQSKLSDLQRAFLLLASFILSIQFEFYRFDDYHTVTDSIAAIAALVVLVSQKSGGQLERPLAVAALLGALAGLSFADRSNDGLLLLCSTSFILFSLAERRQFLSILLAITCFMFVFIIFFLATGDSLDDYLKYTIRSAAAIKGGYFQLLISPLLVIFSIWRYMSSPPIVNALLLIFSLCMLFLSIFIIIYRFLTGRSQRWAFIVAIETGLIAFAATLIILDIPNPIFFPIISGILILFVYVTGCYCIFYHFFLNNVQNSRMMVSLIPIGGIVAGSMSSGGGHIGLYAPLGLFLALSPVIFRIETFGPLRRSTFFGFCIVIIFAGSVEKIYDPASWLNYKTPPMFTGRSIIQHPLYGYIVVNNNTRQFFDNVCRDIKSNSSSPSLLSIPFSYENYYCGISPWKNYVQSFFDTSSEEFVGTMLAKIKSAPPDWILYQRQIRVLKLHENIYNHGMRLPHRDIDDYVMTELRSRYWTLDRVYQDGPDSVWMLVRTRPPSGSLSTGSRRPGVRSAADQVL